MRIGLILLLSLLQLVLYGQATIGFIDFDGTSGNYIGYSISGATSSSTVDSTNSPYIPDSVGLTGNGLEVRNDTIVLTSGDINTSNYSNVQLTFRLASLANTSANGSDAPDSVTLWISNDGGTTWSAEIKIVGNSNAKWTYSGGTAVASATFDFNKSPLIFGPNGAGSQIRTIDGYSTVLINSLPSVSNLRFRISIKNNHVDEVWAIDDIILTGTSGNCSPATSASSASTISHSFAVSAKWTNSSCYDEVVVFMNETAGIQVSPSGSYGSYFGNSVYSSANQCVYNGVSDSIGVTGLDNGKTYYFEIFTRRNSTWSNGEEVSGTPDFGGLTVSKMDSAYIIDFDSTLVGSNNGSFNGTGFSPSPGSGQLNSASWGIAGMSEGKCNFDSTKTSGDFARGTSSGGVGTGGIYAFQISTGNYSLGVQSVGDDFTPGEIICRIANETGATISHILIGYDLYINNDQFRSNSLNFSYSMDGQTFVEISTLNKISYDTSDSRGWRANPNIALITGLSLHDNSYFYLKWKGDEVSGSGSMDEFALDNISISLLSNAPDSIQISVQDSLESLAISGVDAVLMDTCVIGYIHLKNSILYLGINDLTVVDSLFSGSSSEYIETDSVGRLIKVIASPDSFTFPVGRSAFSPITLNFTASSAGHVGVRVVDRIHPNVDTSTATIDYIERFWQVSQTGLSSFNCNVTAIYDDGDIVGTEGNLFMGKWDGGPAWGVGNSVNASDNKLTMNGVTSFSDFTGAGSPVLPLKFLDVFIVNDVLHWLTASELNVNEFIIQVSFDGAHFNKIGSTKAWGNSTEKRTYSFDINTFKSMMYFRIVGVDYDGGKTFSPLAYRANNSNLVQITYLPDAVLLTSSNYTPKKITLFDNCGRNILSFSIDSELKIDRNSLRKGIYIINITEESGKIECYKFINY